MNFTLYGQIEARLLASLLSAPPNIYDSRRHYDITEGEPGPLTDNLSVGTDERVAVIDNSAGFAAQEISVDIANAKSTRTFKRDTFSNLILTEGEMTRAEVEDEVNAP